MQLEQFTYDPGTRVYLSPDSRDFAYSDGKEVEERIYQILTRTADRSTTSDELRRQITDWPTEYHFSSTRHNLLRHLPIGPGTRVLELGCGCGAITRQLGERGADVTAVEGSLARARCAALRCADLPNVRVCCGNFQRFAPGRGYDYVLLVGVLEYAPLFFEAADPIDECLRMARHLLAPTGQLVLAIENRMGLKYLLGQSEDHTGLPYFGVQDLYSARTAKTLGRRELEAALQGAGFDEVAFQYPFPDYKLPRVVLTERAFQAQGFAPADLLRNCTSRDYSTNAEPACSEQLVWHSIHANGLAPDLANSFLVLASAASSDLHDKHDRRAEGQGDLLGIVYTHGRNPSHSVETRFEERPSGEIWVGKRYVHGERARGVVVEHVLAEGLYRPGESLGAALTRAVAQNDSAAILALCRRWIDYVRTNAVASDDRGIWSAQIKPEYIDCVPGNVLIEGARLGDIDREWRLLVPCTLEMLVARGLLCVVLDNWKLIRRSRTSRLREWQGLMKQLGVPSSPALLRSVVDLEWRMQREITLIADGSAKVMWAELARPDGVADAVLPRWRRLLRLTRRRARDILRGQWPPALAWIASTTGSHG